MRAALLPALEAGWNATPAAHEAIGELGLEVALNAGDSAAMRLWVTRALSVVTPGYVYWSLRAGRDRQIRTAIEVSLRAQARTLLDDANTPPSLQSTRQRDRLYRRALAAGALGLLSQELLLDGRLAAARDTVDLAITMTEGMCGFEYLHRYRASVELAAGDTVAAERDLAAGATARFQRTGALGDSAAGLLGGRYDATHWSALLDSARRTVKACTKDWATP